MVYTILYISKKHDSMPRVWICNSLGSSLIGELPSPLLTNRLECPISNSKQNTQFIISGAIGHDEVCTEAYAMKK